MREVDATVRGHTHVGVIVIVGRVRRSTRAPQAEVLNGGVCGEAKRSGPCETDPRMRPFASESEHPCAAARVVGRSPRHASRAEFFNDHRFRHDERGPTLSPSLV